MSRDLVQFGERLVDAGDVVADELRAALERQREHGHPLGETLVELGVLDEPRLIERLEEHFELPHVPLDRFRVDPDAVALVSAARARRSRVLPLFTDRDTVVVAMSDPNDVLAIEELERDIGRPVDAFFALEQELDRAIERCYLGESEDRELLARLGAEFRDGVVATPTVSGRTVAGGEGGPVARAVRSILTRAVRRRATDVHVEPVEGGLRVRLRIDGFLTESPAPDPGMHGAIVSRIKVLANLDISETRLPQDGRFRFPVDGREVDVRASILPTVSGENVVLRLLDDRGDRATLDELGLAGEDLARFRDALASPWGMVLVTGPTGSGKTTTLYAALREIEDPRRQVVTLEDPVESVLPSCRQIQVRPKAGLTFAKGLRAVLRHDPDVVLVGEIRDVETAEIATQAALTGHLILATLHTNDAPGAVARLVDLGVPPFLVEGALAAVLAQRLVRTLCPACKVPRKLDPAELPPALRAPGVRGAAGLPGEPIAPGEPIEAFEAGGCSRCSGAGYEGRTAIHELLVVDDPVREAIARGASATELRRLCAASGFATLRASGFARVLRGVTSVEEVLRVTGAGPAGDAR